MPATTLPLPATTVGRLFGELLNRDVLVADSGPTDLADTTGRVRAVYRSGERIGAVYLLDVELAAALAAALVMLPAGLVRESASSGQLAPILGENCFEVLNVATQLVNRPGGPHHRLVEQILPGEPTPADVAGLLEAASARIDLRLSVEGYGAGVLTVVVR